MHRLLTYKGYRFPNVDSRAASVMNSDNNLKSPEELEEEDRAAQGAKLQELIRRGTPRDLAQAQELMKIMSGAEPENKPDYTKPSTYHPIALMDTMKKILASCIVKRLAYKTEKFTMLPERHFSGKPGRSTSDVLLKTTMFITDAWRKGEVVIALFSM